MNIPEIIFESRPQWPELFQACANLALENVDPGPGREGWLPHMTCMPGVGKIWQWDSCFMAIYAKYLNGVIAPMNNLDDLYSLQAPDGYISMAYKIVEGEQAFGERINPPLYAWTEWLYCQFTGDLPRVRRVLPILVSYYNWIRNHRRRENGLYYFEDSGSSGMDNTPRGGFSSLLNGSSLCWIDLAAQMALSADCIAEMAQCIGDNVTRDAFRREFAELSALINKHHYSTRTNFYHDCYVGTDNLLGAKTIAGFWPMVAGAASPEQARKLAGHLLNPEEFNTVHPVPSLSRDDINYESTGGYWLGGVWAPTNYMVVKGLDRFGWHALAREISRKHIGMIEQVFANPDYASVWECYAPEDARPATRGKGEHTYGMLVRDRFVGWSALGPIAMLIEDVLGFDFNALTSCVTWRIAERGRHGIRNLQFKGGAVSLVCDGLRGPGCTHIAVDTAVPFTLRIEPEGRSESEPTILDIVPGTSEYTF